jgi:hypothetical protein
VKLTDGSERDDVVYRTHFKFNAIYVIESLPLGATKTGQDLYDKVIFPSTHHLEELYTHYAQIPDEAALHEELRTILLAARDANHKPIVHIEAHGTDDGIELADGSAITWRSLVPIFAAINEASEFNLSVIAVSCSGWNLTLSLVPFERAPVAILFGPPDAMSAQDLYDGMSRFYRALVLHIDFNHALDALNLGLPYDRWLVKPATSEVLFCRVFRLYVQSVTTLSNLLDRENMLVADIVRAQKLDVIQSAAVRLAIRPHLADHEWWYNHYRETFLFLDRFPSNRERFGLSYSRCVPAGSHSATADA